MMKIEKAYNFKIYSVAIIIVLFFCTAVFPVTFPQGTLRIPFSSEHQKERIEKLLYLQGHFLFAHEAELQEFFKDNPYKDPDIVRNLPLDREKYLYRGMRLNISSLLDISLNGLKIEKTGSGKIYFVTSPFFAKRNAFHPLSKKDNYPRWDFIPTVIQIDRGTVGALIARQNIASERIRIFIFDKSEKMFIDKTEFLALLATGQRNPRETILASNGTVEGENQELLGNIKIAAEDMIDFSKNLKAKDITVQILRNRKLALTNLMDKLDTSALPKSTRKKLKSGLDMLSFLIKKLSVLVEQNDKAMGEIKAMHGDYAGDLQVKILSAKKMLEADDEMNLEAMSESMAGREAKMMQVTLNDILMIRQNILDKCCVFISKEANKLLVLIDKAQASPSLEIPSFFQQIRSFL